MKIYTVTLEIIDGLIVFKFDYEFTDKNEMEEFVKHFSSHALTIRPRVAHTAATAFSQYQADMKRCRMQDRGIEGG